MKLVLQKQYCEECKTKECLKACPERLSKTSGMECLHCAPEEAECALACKQNAFFEISAGILAIDAKKCNACLECVEACRKKALCIIGQEAKAERTKEKNFMMARRFSKQPESDCMQQLLIAKCSLCASQGFAAECAKACAQKAISMEKTLSEIRETEKALGWRVYRIKDFELNKALREKESQRLIELKDGRRCYEITALPELSLQEARLVARVLEEFQASETGREKDLESALLEHCSENLLELDREQKEYLLKLLDLLAFKYGPISCLLEDDSIEEIALIGLGKQKPVMVFERSFGWMQTNLYYCDEQAVKNLVNKMARRIGRRLTMQSPKLNATLEDGSRLHAAIEPVSFSGPSFTIRKFRQRPFTPIDLMENRTISSEAAAFLWMAMQADCSMLIAGNTGSGKTSTMNALFCFVQPSERIIVTEETPEITLPHKHIVKMNVAENLRIGMQELIVDSLRMRPDRIVVGEIRNSEEVAAFIDTLLAGQGKGSFATFHAQSAAEALARLESLGIMPLNAAAIDLVIVQRRWNKIDAGTGAAMETRRIVEIAEVVEGKGKARLNLLYGFDYGKDALEKIAGSKKVLEKLKKCFGLQEKEILEEAALRKKALEKFLGKGLGFKEFFEKINLWSDAKEIAELA